MRTTLLALALCGAATAATAQTPPDLIDLVGARAGQAENTVTSRGYEWARTMKTGGSSYSYWTRGGSCIQITTTDGRYVSIDSMDRSLCRADGASAESGGACPADVSQADRYKYPACDTPKPRSRDVCPPDVSQADRYRYPACN